MSVDIDEAGGDEFAARVDFLGFPWQVGFPGQVGADSGDAAVGDGDVGMVRLGSAAIDNGAVADD